MHQLRSYNDFSLFSSPAPQILTSCQGPSRPVASSRRTLWLLAEKHKGLMYPQCKAVTVSNSEAEEEPREVTHVTFTQESAVLLFETKHHQSFSKPWAKVVPKLHRPCVTLVSQWGRRRREIRAICDLMNNEILKDYCPHWCLYCPQMARKYDNTNELLLLFPLSHQYTTSAYFVNTYVSTEFISGGVWVIYHYILSSQ